MRFRFSLLLLVFTLVGVVALPIVSRAQAPREIATEMRNPKFLFFLGDEYELHLNVPKKDLATDALVRVKGFDVKRKFPKGGTFSFPDMRLECEGITYTVPAHKVTVLGERPKQAGFYIDAAPDPGGSGNFEMLITYNAKSRPGGDGFWVLDPVDRPKGIEMVDASAESDGSGLGYERKMEVMLRNTTDTPFTITREFFKNLPSVEKWPEIVVPPAHAK